MNPTGKYVAFEPIVLTERTWPNRKITKAPIWCSVDLRDGNQSLMTPMSVAQKIEMFEVLVMCGFKEIEIGFPAASQTEYDFVRCLIEEHRIPDDVTIQVLVQAREELIKRTVESLKGAKRVIIHLYNSTSPAQRRIVFGLKKSEVIALAVQGTTWVKEYSKELVETEVVFQYSPESFSGTEVEFSLVVCEAVIAAWNPSPEQKMIINLPETVEVAMPNVYADQIEWFCRHMTRRDCVIISIHTHNDRGTGVAATEMGILAGADRVEGTLFGNGERTGNLDIIIVALNLFTQGINPELDFSKLAIIQCVYEKCTGMKVPPRHPYSGELVFTAFSGSHQDAIGKGLRARKKETADGSLALWEVPYLIIDPSDIGREYENVIRVNGQSGKGGVAYILEHSCSVRLPKEMQREFGPIAGKKIDELGREVTATDLKKMVWEEYVERYVPFSIFNFHSVTDDGCCKVTATIHYEEQEIQLSGEGNGPIDSFVGALRTSGIIDVVVVDLYEHSLGENSSASAISYVQLQFADGSMCWGAGIATSIELAPVKAVISALNRKNGK